MKLLLKFFSNITTKAYLRNLADEFGESTNAVRVELNRLTEAGLLESTPSGNTVMYKANTRHPIFPEISRLVSKYLGFDSIIDNVVKKLGDVRMAMISGPYAKGIDSGIIDLVIVGNIDWTYLLELIRKTEGLISRKIRPLVLTEEEYKKYSAELEAEKPLILWVKED